MPGTKKLRTRSTSHLRQWAGYQAHSKRRAQNVWGRKSVDVKLVKNVSLHLHRKRKSETYSLAGHPAR